MSQTWPAIVPLSLARNEPGSVVQEPRHALAGEFPQPGFVGRKRELRELLAALEEACHGHGRLFLVVGEAGIGKTRLIEELAAEAAKRGSKVLWGRCWEGEGAPPYWPWVQVIRSYLRDSDAERITTEVGPGAAYLAQLVPEIRHRFSSFRVHPPRLNRSTHVSISLMPRRLF